MACSWFYLMTHWPREPLIQGNRVPCLFSECLSLRWRRRGMWGEGVSEASHQNCRYSTQLKKGAHTESKCNCGTNRDSLRFISSIILSAVVNISSGSPFGAGISEYHRSNAGDTPEGICRCMAEKWSVILDDVDFLKNKSLFICFRKIPMRSLFCAPVVWFIPFLVAGLVRHQPPEWGGIIVSCICRPALKWRMSSLLMFAKSR